MPAPGKTKLIKFPPSRAGKDVKCPGYARGGMLKLRFDRYIRSLFFARPLSLVPRSGLLRNRTETTETFGTMEVIDERRNHGIIPQGPRQYIFIALSPVLYRCKIKMAAIVSSKPLLLISSSLTRVG